MNNENVKGLVRIRSLLPRPDWSLVGATWLRVINELWLPAVGALLAMYWENRTQSISSFDWLAGYFTKLFFFGAFFRYWQVARKLVVDERNHDKIVGKQDQVLTRLEAVGQKLEGLTTGGNGYAYIWDVQTNDSGIDSLYVTQVGDYPMHDIELRIVTREKAVGRHSDYKSTGDINSLLAADYAYSLPILHPKTMKVIPCNIMLVRGADTYVYVEWTARNGAWTEMLYLSWVNNKWRCGSKVWHRNDGESKISEYAGPSYPIDEDKRPVFPAYDN